jgi:hypothetical protein
VNNFRAAPARNARIEDADGILRPFNGFRYTFTAPDLSGSTAGAS